MAAPPGLAAPPLPPHLQPEQCLAAGILPALPPHANRVGSWSARQPTHQQPLVGQHTAGSSPGHAAKTQPQAASPRTGQAAVTASKPGAGSAGGPHDGSIQPSAVALGSANARQLRAAQGGQIPLATAALSDALPPALWPPHQLPAQPHMLGASAAPGVPGHLPPQWLPPPGAAWPAAPSAMAASVSHGPRAVSLPPPQPVPPHLQRRVPPVSGTGGGPRAHLSASALRAGAPGVAGQMPLSLPPLVGRGAPHTVPSMAAAQHLSPPQLTAQPTAGVQCPQQQAMQQHVRQPSSGAPGASSVQRSVGPPHGTAASHASGGRLPPQQWLPAVRPPQQAAPSMAALQQWARQLPHAPGASAPLPRPTANPAANGGGLGPIGAWPQQPALPSPHSASSAAAMAGGAQPPMSKQRPQGAMPPSFTQANGTVAMQHAQVKVSKLTPMLSALHDLADGPACHRHEQPGCGRPTVRMRWCPANRFPCGVCPSAPCPLNCIHLLSCSCSYRSLFSQPWARPSRRRISCPSFCAHPVVPRCHQSGRRRRAWRRFSPASLLPPPTLFRLRMRHPQPSPVLHLQSLPPQ